MLTNRPELTDPDSPQCAALIEEYLAGASPCELARSHDLTLRELMSWADNPAIKDVLAQLSRFTRDRAAIIAEQARCDAVKAMKQCLNSTNPETVRRAAGAIISYARLTSPARARSTRADPPPASHNDSQSDPPHAPPHNPPRDPWHDPQHGSPRDSWNDRVISTAMTLAARAGAHTPVESILTPQRDAPLLRSERSD